MLLSGPPCSCSLLLSVVCDLALCVQEEYEVPLTEQALARLGPGAGGDDDDDSTVISLGSHAEDDMQGAAEFMDPEFDPSQRWRGDGDRPVFEGDFVSPGSESGEEEGSGSDDDDDDESSAPPSTEEPPPHTASPPPHAASPPPRLAPRLIKEPATPLPSSPAPSSLTPLSPSGAPRPGHPSHFPTRHFPTFGAGPIRMCFVLEARDPTPPKLPDINHWQDRRCAQCGTEQSTGACCPLVCVVIVTFARCHHTFSLLSQACLRR